MTRITARGRIGLAAALVIACAMALAAVALAAAPKKGAHFKGSTAATPVNGFHAPVTFTVSSNGRSLKGFSYGSFGCFGAGGFKPGVNPYTGSSIVRVGTVSVSAKGKISVTGAKTSHSVQGQRTETTVSIAGRFATPKKASGTITFSQVLTGSFKGSCGPAKIAFSATGG